MKIVFVHIQALLLTGLVGLFAGQALMAQDSAQTPSQKTKDAVDKFNQAPATIGKAIQDMTEAAKAKLQGLGGKSGTEEKAAAGNLDWKRQKTEAAATEPAPPQIKRDPFRPMSLRTKTSARPRSNLSPLERFELGQLKVVGIVWDVKEPRAMIEDSAGLGYSVKVGTPIGSNEGIVKAIHRNAVVIEEWYEDFNGARKKREVSMGLATE